jgi:hypothetical protein
VCGRLWQIELHCSAPHCDGTIIATCYQTGSADAAARVSMGSKDGVGGLQVLIMEAYFRTCVKYHEFRNAYLFQSELEFREVLNLDFIDFGVGHSVRAA